MTMVIQRKSDIIQPNFNKRTKRPWSVATLFLAGLDGVAVLTCDNFDLLCRDHFVGFHFEGGVLDDERPDVVTETVCVQMTLGKW